MDSTLHKLAGFSAFRARSTLWVAGTALLLVTPFSIDHYLNGRYVLGAGSLAVVILLAVNTWRCKRGRYSPRFTFLTIVPVMTLFLVFAFSKISVGAALWCYPVALSFYFILPEREAWLATIAFLAFILPQSWNTLDSLLALRFTMTLTGTSIFAGIFMRFITEQQARLESQVITDPLTGLLNRTLLNQTLEHAVQQNSRNGAPMTLVALDLDHFKKINDTLGHAAGDQVLSRMGELLRSRIRRADKIFRMGGEEFLALLFDTDLDHAHTFAEELRGTIAALPILADHPVTVSIGAAMLLPDEDWDSWMKRCDDNLYRAKLNGRNQVIT